LQHEPLVRHKRNLLRQNVDRKCNLGSVSIPGSVGSIALASVAGVVRFRTGLSTNGTSFINVGRNDLHTPGNQKFISDFGPRDCVTDVHTSEVLMPWIEYHCVDRAARLFGSISIAESVLLVEPLGWHAAPQQPVIPVPVATAADTSSIRLRS
jgi:hypothetical protein